MAKLHTKIVHIVSGDVISKGFGFLLTIYLTRVLGAEGYGMVTVAMAYLGYAVFFGDFGLFTIGSREVAKPVGKRTFIPFEILTARMILATTVFCLVWLALPFILVESKQLILTRRYLISMLIHAYLVEWFFNGIQRFDITAISRSIQTAIYAIGAFLFINNPSDILELPILYVIGYFFSALILLSIAFKHKAFTYSKNSFHVYIKLLKSSSSVGSGMLFSHVIQLFPPIVIGIFLSTSDAGLYGAAYRLIIIGMLIDRLFVQLLIPNLAKQWSENRERSTINMEHTSRIMLFIGSILSLFIALGANDFSEFLFGADFQESGPIVVSLSLFLFFTFQNSMFSHGLLAIGKDISFFKATSYGGIIAIVLIILVAKYFDSVAVGLAVALSEFFIASLCFFWFRKSLSFNYIIPFIITLFVGLGVYFIFTLIEFMPSIEALSAAIILGVCLLGLRILRLEDVRWLKSILLK